MQQKILLLAANPKGTTPLRLDEEAREISEGLLRSRQREQFQLVQRWAVRPRDIQRAMLDEKPQIVHFSGHGAGEEGLVFEDEVGQPKLVASVALAGLFELFAAQVECVVLNGCYSQVQATAIATHVNYVIGMNKAIGDRAAIEFAVAFYDALGAGRPIEFAHKFGCAAIRLAGIPEHLTPVLKKKPGISKTTAKISWSSDQPQAKKEATSVPFIEPIEVFFSYSHQDEHLRDELAKHLSILKRQGIITAWYDREIGAGTEWAGEIDAHLNTAHVILLLISADFLASDYCYDIELTRAMERHAVGEARVIPVILREVDWKSAPFGKLQALPKNERPVTSWVDRDAAFADVARGIRKTVELLVTNHMSDSLSLSGIRYDSKELFTILHLSDLHFGTQGNAQQWCTQLVADLRHELNCAHLDAVILSGDIANKSTPEEYDAAKLFLNKLITAFQLESDRIVIVPGNHDLNWGLAEEAYSLMYRNKYQGELKEGSYIPVSDKVIEVRDENKYKERFAHFSKFYQEIKGEPYPLEYEQQGILHHLPEQNLLILALNSAWQLDHHYKSRASIHSIALSNALEKIDENYTTYEKCLKIAVWHHPLDSAFTDRITDQGFMEQLAVAGFRLFLHGHIHKAETSLYRYDLSTGGRKLDRICAGTFGAPVREWVTGYPLQYNLLKLEDKTMTVCTRRREELNGAWKPDARWTQGAGKDPLPRYEIQL